MTRILRLLLIVAIALPMWQPMAAQESYSAEEMIARQKELNKNRELKRLVIPDGYLTNQNALEAVDKTKNGQVVQSNAPSIKATQTGQVTVCDGTLTDTYFPVREESFRYGSQSQMIYPKTVLSGLEKGDVITKLTFHAQGTINNNIRRPLVRVRLGETSTTTVTSNDEMTANRNASTQVFYGYLAGGSNTLTITLSTSFTYYGGNLIVDIVAETGGNHTYASNNWFGLEATDASYCRYTTGSNNYTNHQGNFLPKMTIEYSRLELTPRNIVVKDADFFSGKTYSWKKNGVGDVDYSTLDKIATDPDQIIAMLRAVYTDPTIPGNLIRGYTAEGGSDHDANVAYTAAGTLKMTDDGIGFDDTYGWNITTNKGPDDEEDPNIVAGSAGNYWYLNPNQYIPNEEGLTLLLLEMQDSFTLQDVKDDDGNVIFPAVVIQETGGYAQLREIVSKSIKSARIITEARRTGTGTEAGTLFKIDCDKMNKFYFIAKGQLQWYRTMYFESTGSQDFCNYPCYVDGGTYDGFHDPGITGNFFLGHMFEQFSPAMSTSGDDETGALDDIYQLLINMKSFPVIHDCPNVPYVSEGHHFMMYGADSESDDCADVRDMMFFIPDYRMLDWSGRGFAGISNSSTLTQDYFKYNLAHQPTIGMFVIHQNEIPEGTANTDYRDPINEKVTGLYKHQLSWKSNLDDFLPGYMQEYELWEVVVDDFGVESYQPVYYRNANGYYLDANNNPIQPHVDEDGNIVYTDEDGKDLRVPIILHREDLSEFDYQNVYVDMMAGSQTRTYVIRGRDAADSEGKHFLSLQMSNQQEIFIPGTDPHEKARMVGATYYSRYNPDNEKNCYSNKIEIVNNGMTLTSADLNGKTLNFYRSSRAAQVDDDGNVVTDANGNIVYDSNVQKTLVATGTVNGNNIVLTLSNQSLKVDYPVGQSDQNTAGYHANPETISFPFSTSSGHIQFTNGFFFWDNFTVEVGKNAHPLQYLYKMEIGEDYSNEIRVPVYKTDSEINKYTLDDVLGDTKGSLELKDPEFREKVQLSSKTEILRYDSYRWNEKVNEGDHYYIISTAGEDANHNEVEVDIAPTGIAQNQGDYYTVTMNKVQEPEYYYAASAEHQPHVSTDDPSDWATFVDYYPLKNNAQSYVYAPVVELFTKGYKANKVNDKLVARNDYNTYGGPMQNTAVGKLELGIGKAEMTNYYWKDQDNGKYYSYYNILLNYTALNVPEGFELYKVRAWRKIDKDVLREIVPGRSVRIPSDGGWYLYEDINYGDPLTLPDAEGNVLTMKRDNLVGSNVPMIGERSVMIGKPQNPGVTGTPEPVFADGTENELRATFGAERLINSNDDLGSLPVLEAEFKVRAYFTRKSNQLVNTTQGANVPYVLYVLGDGKEIHWWTSKSIANLYSNDGKVYTGNVTITESDDVPGYGKFSFTKMLGVDWPAINAYRIGADTENMNYAAYYQVDEANLQQPIPLRDDWSDGTRDIRIKPGTYKFVVTLDGNTKNLVITPAPANAPRLEGETALPGSDFDYYIAEGTYTFDSSETPVITGIVDVLKSSEVVGVTYYNVAGIESSTPFDGVNIVVTRYSDGSTTTTKILK